MEMILFIIMSTQLIFHLNYTLDLVAPYQFNLPHPQDQVDVHQNFLQDYKNESGTGSK